MTEAQAAEDAFAKGNYRAAARLAAPGSATAEHLRIDLLPLWITLAGFAVQGVLLALHVR
jgi:hypothetical protein